VGDESIPVFEKDKDGRPFSNSLKVKVNNAEQRFVFHFKE
jgi:hypothetical protein